MPSGVTVVRTYRFCRKKMSTINPDDFKYLCGFILEKSGISLSEDKAYLLDSRLLPIVRRHGMKDISALVGKLRIGADEALVTEIIEAMTTNETSFFRDLKPFDNFRDVILPHVVSSSKEGTIRIWCGAASSGQESYSLAMTALEHKAKLGGKNIEIVGTDIDRTILKKAENGIYSQFEVQRGLPIMLLMKYFTQGKDGDERWTLNDEVRKVVKFQYLNLLDHYDGLGKFDIVFCRNVLIYFEPDVKTQILEKIARTMKPHATLQLGSAETVTGLTDKFKAFQDIKGVYCLA